MEDIAMRVRLVIPGGRRPVIGGLSLFLILPFRLRKNMGFGSELLLMNARAALRAA